jgi:hypothetical protein
MRPAVTSAAPPERTFDSPVLAAFDQQNAACSGSAGQRRATPGAFAGQYNQAPFMNPLIIVTLNLRPLLLFLSLAAGTANGADADSGKSPDVPQTGEFVLLRKTSDLVSAEAAASIATVVSPDEEIAWQLYVPPSYDPSKPAGLLVYVSPTPSGEIPRGWSSVLDSRNVIWIGTDRAGNSELVARRILFAMLAPTVARQHYEIDAERIYITGLSGGGKTASMVATDQAQMFRGAIYNCGVEFWDTEPERIELIRQNHYVFVTGTYDQALEPTKKAYRGYRKAGVENSRLMVIRHKTHRNPDSYEFEESLLYLDSRLKPGS